jgi:hypothetical protein
MLQRAKIRTEEPKERLDQDSENHEEGQRSCHTSEEGRRIDAKVGNQQA